MEVKWSDNQDREHGVLTALEKQLGDKYLLDESLTHGVYFVGWNGKLGPFPASLKKPVATAQGLKEFLIGRAQTYCSRQSLDIRVVVFDLHYPLRASKKNKKSATQAKPDFGGE